MQPLPPGLPPGPALTPPEPHPTPLAVGAQPEPPGPPLTPPEPHWPLTQPPPPVRQFACRRRLGSRGLECVISSCAATDSGVRQIPGWPDYCPTLAAIWCAIAAAAGSVGFTLHVSTSTATLPATVSARWQIQSTLSARVFAPDRVPSAVNAGSAFQATSSPASRTVKGCSAQAGQLRVDALKKSAASCAEPKPTTASTARCSEWGSAPGSLSC